MAGLIEVRDLSIEFDNRGMRGARARSGLVSHRARLDGRAGRRIGIGQVGDGAGDHAHPAANGSHHVGRDPVHAARRRQAARSTSSGSSPDGSKIRRIRGRHISMIFQEPMVSLSPLHTIGDQVSEALFLHHRVGHKEGMARTEDMLRRVGFPDPARALRTYPFELSGGLRQRAMIAMALVCRPSLLIADEPTTALDVTIQAQILALIKELQAELEMAVLIITHDLGVVANLAEHVVVLYAGRVMEQGPVHALFERPAASVPARAAARGPAFRHEARRAPGLGAHRRPPDGAARRDAGAVAGRCGPGASRRAQRRQDVRAAVDRLSGAARGPAVSRGRRREPDDHARRVLRPRRRKRLRQDDAVQGDHARARAGRRRRALQRPRQDARRRARRGRSADAVPPPRPIHLPGPVRLAVARG